MQRAPADQPQEGDDLPTIGLVVFFLGLILVVGALLLAPALF
jgi:hypothetical protein